MNPWTDVEDGDQPDPLLAEKLATEAPTASVAPQPAEAPPVTVPAMPGSPPFSRNTRNTTAIAREIGRLESTLVESRATVETIAGLVDASDEVLVKKFTQRVTKDIRKTILSTDAEARRAHNKLVGALRVFKKERKYLDRFHATSGVKLRDEITKAMQSADTDPERFQQLGRDLAELEADMRGDNRRKELAFQMRLNRAYKDQIIPIAQDYFAAMKKAAWAHYRRGLEVELAFCQYHGIEGVSLGLSKRAKAIVTEMTAMESQVERLLNTHPLVLMTPDFGITDELA